MGGILQRGGGGIAAAERGEGSGAGGGATGFGGGLRDLVGRWPDADVVLQGGMSEGLRDWDLWYVVLTFYFYSRQGFTLPPSLGDVGDWLTDIDWLLGAR